MKTAMNAPEEDFKSPGPMNQWDNKKLEAWKSTRRLIARKMTGKHSEFVDDVHQDTFIAATKNMHLFDADRGSFEAWISGVAKNRVAEYMKKVRQQFLLEEKAMSDAQNATSYMSHEEPDHSDDIINRLDTLARVSRVLKIVECSWEQRLYDRSMFLIRDCDGDFSLAAKRLGMKATALRESHRQMMELAQVIDRALVGHYERVAARNVAPVTIREILACFPDPEAGDMEREWLRFVPLAVMKAGAFSVSRNELVDRVSRLTGYAPVTARHVVARCERLCLIARTVLESGSEIYGESLMA